MTTDPAFWSSLRKDFESLHPLGQFSLIWTSQPPVSMLEELLPSQWTWFRVPDESLRARLSSIALKGARAFGSDSEDEWFEALRKADFVEFELTGSGRWNKPDGTVYQWESGKIDDVVKHSITLCYVLETRAEEVKQPERTAQDRTDAAEINTDSILTDSSSAADQLVDEESILKATIIRRLSAEGLVRLEAGMAAFLADYEPKLERQANKRGPVHDAELLRELVVHQFNLVARECMAVCASVEEFESDLGWDITRFVRYVLRQYQWLAGAMREELERGFTFFLQGTNPWAEIPAKDRASVWHVGAITGEALTHAAVKLRAEALSRAASRGAQKPAITPNGDELTRGEAAQGENGPKANGGGRKRGPKPDLETTVRVAEIVTRVAPDGDWRSKLDDVCDALDEDEIPCPKTWRKNRNYRCWGDCVERDIVVKAIEYRLEIAKQRKKDTSRTFS